DGQGQPLTKSMTWADNRSAAWAEQLKQEPRSHDLYRRTGTPIHAMSPLVKLIWLRQEKPQLFAQAAKFISIKEYIFYRLFQDYWVDYAIASATGLFNLQTLTWDQEALEIAGITEHKLSQLVPTTQVLRPMNPTSAELMGIPVDTPIVIGASDGGLANLSVGAIAPGKVVVTVGTSGAVRTLVNQPWTDPQERLFCYALTPDLWIVGGAVNSGGIILQWVRDQLSHAATAAALDQDPYDWLAEMAQSVAPGAGGLIFHPYLAGERAPLWDNRARGAFIGLTLEHTQAHLIRAVFEGIAFNLNLVLQALQDCIGIPTSIQATGGLAQSEFWRQLLADVFVQEVSVVASYGSSCWGAAVLGLYALQRIPSLDAINSSWGNTQRYIPNPDNVEVYRKIFPVYMRLLDCLQEEYANLAECG
ncbi:MAG: FGGY family carbohydrate kinase, partial [Leptolyngbyaceae bacterium]|nr:FGGY family carbohydrate kinase [Leptolyngbyaceae bacterium]